ncbi:DNA-3-methyladenine glycosylase 1 [Posidoniimonas corsicana]|uniref:DNA-3-methyladenine glycosylase 1 n=1 Tax=Posidoniimonas corsicana TaxID=1938618 RepID=A0A5C5V6X9_9BACT|nr:DNA-3-methyladenine glycosylase I [Posidoniimonas corsicana]TWT33713.1 DNA-3-methyladenine glycosylase 1 [Posidoniimonas corsicana]
MPRCPWAEVSDLDRAYHDEEWGVPIRGDDPLLFEMLTLEGAQAGLSWTTVLAKREGYRRCFAGFDPVKVARFTEKRVDKLVADPAIIRHRGKIESTVSNATAVLNLQSAGETLSDFLWGFVDGAPRKNNHCELSEVPSQTPESVAMSKELKRRGFRFVGPTTCYALMQAAGMVNDHLVSCPRHKAVRKLG